jgi:hypothetical protein
LGFPQKGFVEPRAGSGLLRPTFLAYFSVLLCCITTSQKDYNGKVMAGITLETSGLLSRKVHQNWGKFMHGIIG